ncbi:BA75_02229T0 [Komagataella pastoris]|uniref:Probable electron transfer flavoprotein subunit alpha n=1 Tax=Komagataella pastoris TaxID=4922 RepID=A0A1B2JBF4_PICPA|nr:BA75_02229T0 [Komagataella pastoris]
MILTRGIGLATRTIRRLGSTLAFVEGQGGNITVASLASLTAASQIGNTISVLVAGSNASSIASQLPKDVVSKVFVAEDSSFDHNAAELITPLVSQVFLDQNFTHFVTPASTVGKNILPRLAAVIDRQPISEITAVKDASTFVRPIYAGNALQTVQTTEPQVLVSVRGTSFEPVKLEGSAAPPVELVTLKEAPASIAEFVNEQLLTSDKPDLGSATRVVSGGRGLKSKENFESLLNPLADKLGAAIGASRAAVDLGFVDNSLQVGQTGKVVAPELYIAVGLSGAIQHLAGMKDSKTIVAINKDEDAPIFSVADIGLVGDIFEVVPELTEKL